MERRSTDMRHALLFQPFSQITRDVAGPIIAQKTRLVAHDCLVATRRGQRQFDRIRHITSPHVGAELPRDDVAAVIVQDCAEIIPTPDDNLEVGEVCLPHLVEGSGFVCELIRGLDHHVVRRGDEIGFL